MECFWVDFSRWTNQRINESIKEIWQCFTRACYGKLGLIQSIRQDFEKLIGINRNHAFNNSNVIVRILVFLWEAFFFCYFFTRACYGKLWLIQLIHRNIWKLIGIKRNPAFNCSTLARVSVFLEDIFFHRYVYIYIYIFLYIRARHGKL